MKLVKLLTAFIMLFVFSSCGISADTVTPENEQSPAVTAEESPGTDIEPSENPSTSGKYAPVEIIGKLPDIYTESIIKNKLLFNVMEMSDGFLCTSTSKAGKTHADKYDKSGALVWSKEYELMPADSYNGYTVAPAADEGFIIGINPQDYHRDDGSMAKYDPAIARFDKDGNLLWKTTYTRYGDCLGSTFDKIFCLPGGGIITVGTKSIPETKAAETGSARDDVYLSKLDKEGKLVDERYYGGTHLDGLWFGNEVFIDGYGIVAAISTQSKDGTFSASIDGYPVTVMVMLDTDLNIKWQRALPRPRFYDGLYIFGNNIYTIQYLYGNADVNPRTSELQILNMSGDEILLKNLGPEGVSLVPGSNSGAVLQFSDKLVKLDACGNRVFEMPFDAGNVIRIIEYDNYFLALSYHDTGELPTPEFIYSVINDGFPWHGSEDVYSGYDYSGNLLWQYAYDTTPEYMKDYDPENEDEWWAKWGKEYGL